MGVSTPAPPVDSERSDDALLAPGGADWRKRLDAGEGDNPAPRVVANARHRSGQEFPVELVFIPVPLSQSLEMSRLLEVLGIGASDDEKLSRLRHGHGSALDSMLAAASGKSVDEDDARLAGLVVTFQAAGDAPWADGDAAVPDGTASTPAPVARSAAPPDAQQLLRVG